MKRRERHEPEPGEFHDPLKNYDPPHYADGFEKSLCQDSACVIEHEPYTAVTCDTPIRQTLRQMAEENIACVVVIDGERKPVGILSEQDVVHRIASDYEHLADDPISSVMTPNPVIVYESENPARVVNVMGTGFFRHVPVCDVDGKFIGVIGARRLMRYLQQQIN